MIILLGTLSLTAVFAILTWQAKRGQPLIHPDGATLAAFAAVAAFTVIATATTILNSRRRPPPANGLVAAPPERDDHQDPSTVT